MKQRFEVVGMSCAACSAHVDKAVRGLNGVSNVNVNLLTNSMDVIFDEKVVSVDDIIQSVIDAGYDAYIKQNNTSTTINKTIDKALIKLLISIFFLLVLMYFSMGNMMWGFPAGIFDMESELFGIKGLGFSLIQFILVLPIIGINFRYFVSGFKKLFGGSPNMDTLIAVGATFSLGYGIYCLFKIISGEYQYHMYLYFESAGMILVFVSIGKYLESLSKRKTTKAIEKLMDLAPKTAKIIKNNVEVEVKVEEVMVGDIVILKKGESAPVDGVIIEGSCSLDQSYITGESLPVFKNIGDEIYSSTICTAGYVKFKATKVGMDSSINQIIKLVEEASSSKAPISKLADKISSVFVPLILGISLVVFLVNFLYIKLANPSFISSNAFEISLNFAITVVVIACPCALGLATPVAIMVGTGKGAESGLLIKNAEILERAHSINTVVLDKTGTITNGKPIVTDLIYYSKDDIYSIIYAFEKKSEHPLAKALVTFSAPKANNDYEITEYIAVDGYGIEGKIGNDDFAIGNDKYLTKYEISDNNITEILNNYSIEGKTPLIIFKNKKIIGIICVKDEVKSSSKEAVNELKNLGIRVIMLTGDNEVVAEKIAEEVEVDEVIANVIPQDKQNVINSLKSKERVVAMVGDGVNDALALTSSDLGIAIGAGSDVAKESSDIVLLKNDLFDVSNVIRLSKKVLNTIKLGLFWAFFYNSICVVLSTGIFYYLSNGSFKMEPMYGSIAMSISSVSVVLNALTINFFKPKNSVSNEISCECAVNIIGDVKEEPLNTIIIGVSDMMCVHCIKRVQDACLKVDGVVSAVASLEKKNVIVESKFDNKEEIERNIKASGYKVYSL